MCQDRYQGNVECLPRLLIWRNLFARTLLCFPPKFPSPMVPFEPRTDSQKLEMPGLNQRSTRASRSATSEAADLTIRILRHDASSGTAALTWNTESVLVYMIADLVRASHGRNAIELPASLAAHFDNSLEALVAARRIQTAILEFLARRPDGGMGAAVFIHPEAGFPQKTAQSALDLARPGQIIVSQEVSARFQNLPGIDLRPVPALTTGGTEAAGLSELIWISAERLASRESTASVAPTANVASPVGATMIVNASLSSTEPRDETASRAARSPGSSQALNASLTPPDGLRHRAGGFEETLAEFEEHRSFITPLKMGVAAAALVVVVVGVVLFHPWSGSNVQPKPQAIQKPIRAPVATPEPPIRRLPQPPAVPVEGSHPKPPILKASSTRKPAVTAQDTDPTKKPEDTPIQGFEGNSTYDGMTRKDIPRLLQWARSDAGNGNYAKAAQEYRVILQLEPSNPDAREGLRKIQVAQGREQ